MLGALIWFAVSVCCILSGLVSMPRLAIVNQRVTSKLGLSWVSSLLSLTYFAWLLQVLTQLDPIYALLFTELKHLGGRGSPRPSEYAPQQLLAVIN